MAIIRGAKPYELGTGNQAVLLVHGLTGTPFEMRPLAEHLAEKGYFCRGMLLPGHGTTPKDLDKRKWSDWFRAVESEQQSLLEKTGSPVFLAGISLGALLVMQLAAKRQERVSALAALSVPLKPSSRILWIARLFKYSPLRPFLHLPRKNRDDEALDDLRLKNPSYDVMPSRALVELVDNISKVGAILPQVIAPALVAHGRLDPTALLEGGRLAFDKLGSGHKEWLVLDRSLHLITLDTEREMLFHKISDFFRDS
ncbi:MAG: alpha/beta fold hydrolase [Deltaproteobacteria bacterium]|nr:alpha/beta fold hydrolase [Deltaproteobacteria bacterium]